MLAPFQAWQDEPSYLTARIVIVAFGVAAVAAAWWLGRAAYGKTAGLVAAVVVAVETIGVAYSHMAVTDVPMTALVDRRRSRSPSAAGSSGRELAAGLAASAKYPAVFLVVPLVVAGWGQWRRLAISIGLAIARVPRDEPVRARPPAPGLERRLARPAARPRRAGSASSTTRGRCSRSPGSSGTGSARCS